MLPFGIGFSELVIIFIVLILVVGPQKLPEIARLFGKGLRTARRASDELKNALAIDEIKREIYRPVDQWKSPHQPEGFTPLDRREETGAECEDEVLSSSDLLSQDAPDQPEADRDVSPLLQSAAESDGTLGDEEPMIQGTDDPLLAGIQASPIQVQRATADDDQADGTPVTEEER